MAEKYSLLLVDDEEDLLSVLEDFFEDEDCFSEVFTAFNAESALEIINKEKIDVVISDERMGNGMTGREFLKKVVSEYSSIKFYLSTGDLDISEDEIIAKGAAGLVIKPYDIDELVERIVKELAS